MPATPPPPRQPLPQPPRNPPAARSAGKPAAAARTGAADRADAPGAAPAALVAGAERLDAALRDLIVAHEELLRLAAVQRDALARADARALADVVNAQAAVAQRVAELEQQRQGAVALLLKAAPQAAAAGAAGGAGAGVAAGRATVSSLARVVADPMRTRILALAERLREVLNRLHGEHMALKQAAETLSAHMEGLMRQVCRKLSHAGTYGRAGAIEMGGAVVTAIDVRS